MEENRTEGRVTRAPHTSCRHELHRRARLAHCQPSAPREPPRAIAVCDPLCRCSLWLAELRHRGELAVSLTLRAEKEINNNERTSQHGQVVRGIGTRIYHLLATDGGDDHRNL